MMPIFKDTQLLGITLSCSIVFQLFPQLEVSASLPTFAIIEIANHFCIADAIFSPEFSRFRGRFFNVPKEDSKHFKHT